MKAVVRNSNQEKKQTATKKRVNDSEIGGVLEMTIDHKPTETIPASGSSNG